MNFLDTISVYPIYELLSTIYELYVPLPPESHLSSILLRVRAEGFVVV